MSIRWLDRLVELLGEDKELRDAVLEYIMEMTRVQKGLADYRELRNEQKELRLRREREKAT